jgi:hypothetical protein
MSLVAREARGSKIAQDEIRIFECRKCSAGATVTVPDPLKSDALRWLSGELGRTG